MITLCKSVFQSMISAIMSFPPPHAILTCYCMISATRYLFHAVWTTTRPDTTGHGCSSLIRLWEAVGARSRVQARQSPAVHLFAPRIVHQQCPFRAPCCVFFFDHVHPLLDYVLRKLIYDQIYYIVYHISCLLSGWAYINILVKRLFSLFTDWRSNT